MYKIFILFVMTMLYSVVNAQNIVSGKITDTQKNALVEASVFIPEMNLGTTSDSEGNYKLSNLPNGKFKIQFSYLGYTNHIETLDIQGDVTLNVILEQTAIEGEEIVISTGYNNAQHDNAVKVDVLKINPLSVKNTPNFAEILTSVPGVDMISKGSGVAKPVIRGLSMNDILVLNNGVRFENYQYSSHHPLGIDEFGIENVEIIKGPASLIYGSDAIGGVVNFIKEKPANIGTIVGDFNSQYFSNSLGFTNNLGIKGASENFFAGIRVGQKSNADYLQGGGDFVPNSRFNEYSLKSNVGFSKPFGTFKLFYDVNNQKLGLVEDEAIENIIKRGRKNEWMYQELNTHLISSQNKLRVGSYKLDVNAALQSTELTHFGEPDFYELQMRLATLTYEAKLLFPSQDKSEYIIGFQGFNQKNKNINDRETILLPDATTENYSLYGLVQFEPLDKLKVQTGVRYDQKYIKTDAVGTPSDSDTYRPALDKKYGSFSGSLGGTYHLSNDLLYRINFAAAYRTPNIAELTSKGPHETRFELGDENLNPEKSYESDMSLHYHKGNFILDVAGFYNIINDYIFIAPTGSTTDDGLYIYKYFQQNSKLYGGEIGVHYHPKNLDFLHLESTFSTVVGKQDNGDYLPFIPAHKLNFEIRAEKENFLGMNEVFVSAKSNTAFNQDHAAPDEIPTDGYTLFDFNLGGTVKWQSQKLVLNVSVNNVLDTRYIDHLSTLKEVNFYNPGRNIAISLKIPFGLQ